jgi:hypothetical protein
VDYQYFDALYLKSRYDFAHLKGKHLKAENIEVSDMVSINCYGKGVIMNRVMLAAIFIISLSACGNSDNSTFGKSGNLASLHLPTLPSQDIRGTYELANISGCWLYGNGVRCFDDTSIVRGSLELGIGTFYQVIAYDNDPLGVPQTIYIGSYSINYTNGTEEGTIGIISDNMNGSGTFTTSGNNLLIDISGSQATWTKISDSIN